MKTIKNMMIELIKKSTKLEENFILEKLQNYMIFKDNKAIWANNIRLRMIENKEAREQGIFNERDRILELINNSVILTKALSKLMKNKDDINNLTEYYREELKKEIEVELKK